MKTKVGLRYIVKMLREFDTRRDTVPDYVVSMMVDDIKACSQAYGVSIPVVAKRLNITWSAVVLDYQAYKKAKGLL